jgi:hypothetical protein
MSSRRSDPQSGISVREAERAIYIDCEGFQGQAPALIGVLIEVCLEQVVLDPVLGPVADARGHRCASLRDEVQRLVDLSIERSVPIVAYSQHERNLFVAFARTDIGERYRDARKIAVRWRNTLHREAPRTGNSLKDFLRFIGFQRGSHLGDRQSTKRIRAVRDMLQKRGSYERLTPVKKAQWTKLLDHNSIDCRGMQALVIRAATELSGRESGETPVDH